MAKIIKVASTTNTPQTVNPFRTSRNSTTNPFKYQNFEGNTLQFADVFEGYNTPFKGTVTTSKMKIVAASVVGCMNKIKSGFEPVVNFVSRIGNGISSAWTYAKNTNISDLAAVKTLNEIMNKPIEIPGLSYWSQSIKSGIKTGMETLNTNVTDIGKDLGAKWTALISKFNTEKISPETPVKELEELWKEQIALEVGGVV